MQVILVVILVSRSNLARFPKRNSAVMRADILGQLIQPLQNVEVLVANRLFKDLGRVRGIVTIGLR